MRVKFIACLAIAALLVSAPVATASLAGLTFPVIRPVYASGGDVDKIVALMGDVVKFSKGEVTSQGTSPRAADFPVISGPLNSIPGPDLFMSALAPPLVIGQPPRDNISMALVGKNLTYYSIAGKPMNYTITADSIKGINRTVYKNKLAWKVRVGEGMAWDIIMDRTGKKILKTEQLFQT